MVRASWFAVPLGGLAAVAVGFGLSQVAATRATSDSLYGEPAPSGAQRALPADSDATPAVAAPRAPVKTARSGARRAPRAASAAQQSARERQAAAQAEAAARAAAAVRLAARRQAARQSARTRTPASVSRPQPPPPPVVQPAPAPQAQPAKPAADPGVVFDDSG